MHTRARGLDVGRVHDRRVSVTRRDRGQGRLGVLTACDVIRRDHDPVRGERGLLTFQQVRAALDRRDFEGAAVS